MPDATVAESNNRITVSVLKSQGSVRRLEEQWLDLASQAIEPNVFYESFHLVPALERLAGGCEIDIVCVFLNTGGNQKKLIGLLPIEHLRSVRGLPIKAVRVWAHSYFCLSTPLIHEEWPREAWGAILDWSRGVGAAVIEFPVLLAEGDSYKSMIDVLRDRTLLSFPIDHFTRAFLSDGARVGVPGISASTRNQLARKRRRLEEMGQLEFRALQGDDDIDAWIEDFLRLEAGGWKGEEGTAILCRQEDAEYFRRICRASFALGRLHMPCLMLDGKAIAMQCNFLTQGGAFSWKVAYDESFSKFSPGMLLDLESVAHFPNTSWMDSCAAPKSYCDSLWGGRRSIQHLLVATGARRGALAIGVLSLLRSLKRAFQMVAVMGYSFGTAVAYV